MNIPGPEKPVELLLHLVSKIVAKDNLFSAFILAKAKQIMRL